MVIKPLKDLKELKVHQVKKDKHYNKKIDLGKTKY